MNEIIQLQGMLHHRKSNSSPGPAALPANTSVSSDKIRRLISEIRDVHDFWKNEETPIRPLVSIKYNSVVAKSNRVRTLLSCRGRHSDESVAGARFSDDPSPRHIITYCVDLDDIKETERKLSIAADILDSRLGGIISSEVLDDITHSRRKFSLQGISKTKFADVIKESFYADEFFVPGRDVEKRIDSASIITLYDTGYTADNLLANLGIPESSVSMLDRQTMLLDPAGYSKLYSKYPYLISMAVREYGITPEKSLSKPLYDNDIMIPDPSNEPVIGVIDTLFSDDAYFSKWVEYHDCISNDIPKTSEDYEHGTAVSSLIVDGPALNPFFDDGCGRFRVRHFGVALKNGSSSVSIVKSIRRIVEENKDIKVWNLSLGSPLETPLFSISSEAAVLDRIQTENDVLFVIAGTNAEDCSAEYPRLGSPADSINSITVNSSDLFGRPADYSRRGPVLGFFNKPDVSCFGGTREDKIIVWTDKGRTSTDGGTSYAAPWITRKAAFLIYKMKFSREIAKALIIDSAAGWNTDSKPHDLQGFGIVPKRIEEILTTPNDEIKFFIHGQADKFDTYAYNIPVPKRKDDFPFTAKATLVYFPECSRSQGVDYTDTELNIHLGKMNGAKISPINDDMQGEPERIILYEKDARALYRKWDNVKHISESFTGRNRPKKGEKGRYDWGISIKKKKRTSSTKDKPVNFGLIVTLKNINGENLSDEFIRLCNSFHEWVPIPISIESRLELYNKADSEIVFD